MDPISGVSNVKMEPGSGQDARSTRGRRAGEAARDKVEVTPRASRPAEGVGEPMFAVLDEAGARELAHATTERIIAEPQLAARAQANGTAEGVLALLG